jgi:catalase (peroxidase I)
VRPEELLADCAQVLTLTALIDGMRSLDANIGGGAARRVH